MKFYLENKILKKAEEKILYFKKNNEINKEEVISEYFKLKKNYEKMLRKFEKLIKINDIQQQKLLTLTDKFKSISHKDDLTNIYNRRKLKNILVENYNKFINDNTSIFSITLIDIDFFKNVNDTFGHDIGDQIIKEISTFILENKQKEDYFGRWGGEEFLIISPQKNCYDVKLYYEKLRKIISEKVFSDKNIQKTCSFGITTIKINDTLDTLLKRSDVALYIAKENGRNRIEIL
ncbi:diguanylate cyclase (GGDEF)-like protein [Hypnocyclicus thermotrophus]|uniref:Diguanylate cyclase (GGDEF)-like protein n=1 Tax=Hypnocyclicus thermotrophus TaxID=1627895 RepID=A0AA46E1I8_9FUSO|nr:GGDEF domain-containing protein [Hypnocyclicus thermotrophus]TDT72528.1 diguanylate cyclase (GGDEF)-like protein [Hypnocyclicus thermotrophus]